MPRYFFDVEDGHRSFDSSGFVCDDDISAIIRATVLAVGISLDQPEDEERVSLATFYFISSSSSPRVSLTFASTNTKDKIAMSV